ncbi:MAG: dockerin type I domain-containing protein, partial [Candidatus Zixiibacteriota bacterium]
TFASVNFGFDEGVTDPWANGGGGEIGNLANFANKWVGFGRGDVNDDNAINLGDIMTLADIVGGSVPGAIPFQHLADVDADDDVDNADLNYLINYYFGCGPCPVGEWEF